MRSVLLIVFLSVAAGAIAQKKSSFAALKYDKVVIYDYDPSDKYGNIVEPNGKLTKKIKKQAELDKTTVDLLNTKLGQKNSFGNGTSACFVPHLGVVYYLNKSIVANIAVCLSCNRLKASLPLDAQKQGKYGAGKEMYVALDGMSERFRKFLNQVLIKHGFSHQL